MHVRTFVISLLGIVALSSPLGARVTIDAPVNGRPSAIIDLATEQGVELVKGQWRYRDTTIVEVDHHRVGADLRPSGPPNRTHDITPHAGAADFDDSQWETLAPTQLEARKSTGRLCFNWYRISITIPDKIGNFDPT